MSQDSRVAIDILKQKFGENLSTGDSVRALHTHTLTWIEPQLPDAVLFAQTTQDVVEAVNICAAHKLPIIAFGVGSSLEGHLNAPLGGLSIDLSQMNEVIKVNAQDMDVVVQPGVTRKQLNEYIRDTGLFFPIDPGADASLGGMAATRASGTNAVRYGTMKDNVINLTAVMADGQVIKTTSRAKKSSAGYDLTRLLVGSEGTLGIITELTIKLHGIPETIKAGVCTFPSIAAACATVIETMQCGIPVARIELLDPLQVRACNGYSGLELKEAPTLFIELHGSESAVAEQAEFFADLAEGHEASDIAWTQTPEENSKLWAARHDAYWASMAMIPGRKGFSTDCCVPISRLADCITETHEDIAASKLIAPIVGHVGDGNFHVLVLMDMDDAEEVQRARDFVSRLSKRAIEMDGTCSGEHGIGQGKLDYMRLEHGPALDVMKTIKKALDPQNILNPGKIFPQE